MFSFDIRSHPVNAIQHMDEYLHHDNLSLYCRPIPLQGTDSWHKYYIYEYL